MYNVQKCTAVSVQIIGTISRRLVYGASHSDSASEKTSADPNCLLTCDDPEDVEHCLTDGPEIFKMTWKTAVTDIEKNLTWKNVLPTERNLCLYQESRKNFTILLYDFNYTILS